MDAYRLILVASALTLIACGDSGKPSLTDPTGATPPAAPVLQRLHGTVVLGQRLGAPALQTEKGLIEMQGLVANAMASVDGADVDVIGTYDGAFGLMVESFEVTGYGGRVAVDGFLEVDENEIYSVRRANNVIVPIENPPEGLKAYVGQRIWLMQSAGELPTEFGAIPIFR